MSESESHVNQLSMPGNCALRWNTHRSTKDGSGDPKSSGPITWSLLGHSLVTPAKSAGRCDEQLIDLIGGPWRDRTYDQLIKLRAPDLERFRLQRRDWWRSLPPPGAH